MRTALTRGKPDFATLTAVVVQLAVVIGAALLLYTELVRTLDDPIISVVLTLTALLTFVALVTSNVRRRP